jgi:hypothetical protein
MITGAASVAILVKLLPYIITVKIAGGIVDIAVHAVKHKIGRIR